MAFRETTYQSLDQLQANLDRYLAFYNREQAQQGYRTKSRTPFQAFLDGIAELQVEEVGLEAAISHRRRGLCGNPQLSTADQIGNLALAILAPAARPQRLLGVARAGEQLMAELAARQHVDRRVDRLVRYLATHVVRIAPSQVPSNLLRRPAAAKRSSHESPKPGIIELLRSSRPVRSLCAGTAR